MMYRQILYIFLLLGFHFLSCTAYTQNYEARQDSLKQAVITLQHEVDNINLNLQRSKKQMRIGVLVATIGYTVTIIGGLTLSNNSNVGNALLITGGAVGITGTVLMVDSFKYFGRRSDAGP